MGMFDEIRVEKLLPGNTEITNEWYQTKSFDNVMTRYVITAKGELYEELWEYEWIDDDTTFFKGYSQKIEGSYNRKYLTNYHGDIIFYNSDVTDNKWRDYFARFSCGLLGQIWYVDKKYDITR